MRLSFCTLLLLLLHVCIICVRCISIGKGLSKQEKTYANNQAPENATRKENSEIKALLDYDSGLIFYKDKSISACLVERIPDIVLHQSDTIPTFKFPIPSEEICLGRENELLELEPLMISEPGLLFCSGLAIVDINKLTNFPNNGGNQLQRRKRQSNGYYRTSAPTGEAKAQSNWNSPDQASQAQVQGQVFGSGFFSGQAQSQNGGISQSQVQLSGVGIRGQIASSSGKAQSQLSLGSGAGSGQAAGLGEGPSSSQVQVQLGNQGEESMASASSRSGGAQAGFGIHATGGAPSGNWGQHGGNGHHSGLRNGGGPGYGFTPGTRVFDGPQGVSQVPYGSRAGRFNGGQMTGGLSGPGVTGHGSGMNAHIGHGSGMNGHTGHGSGMNGHTGHGSGINGHTGHGSGINGHTGHGSGINGHTGHGSGINGHTGHGSGINGHGSSGGLAGIHQGVYSGNQGLSGGGIPGSASHLPSAGNGLGGTLRNGGQGSGISQPIHGAESGAGHILGTNGIGQGGSAFHGGGGAVSPVDATGGRSIPGQGINQLNAGLNGNAGIGYPGTSGLYGQGLNGGGSLPVHSGVGSASHGANIPSMGPSLGQVGQGGRGQYDGRGIRGNGAGGYNGGQLTAGYNGQGLSGQTGTPGGIVGSGTPSYGGSSSLSGSNGGGYLGGASTGGRPFAQSNTPGAHASTYGMGQAQAQTVYFGNMGNGQYAPIRYDQSSQPGGGDIQRFQDQQVGIGSAGQRQQLSQNGAGTSGTRTHGSSGGQGGLVSNGHQHNLRNGYVSYGNGHGGAQQIPTGQQPIRNGAGILPSSSSGGIHQQAGSSNGGGLSQQGGSQPMSGSIGEHAGYRPSTTGTGGGSTGVSGTPLPVGGYTNGVVRGQPQSGSLPNGNQYGTVGSVYGQQQPVSSGRNGQTYRNNGNGQGAPISGTHQRPGQTYRINGNGQGAPISGTHQQPGQTYRINGNAQGAPISGTHQQPGQTGQHGNGQGAPLSGTHQQPGQAGQIPVASDVDSQDGFSPSYGISRPSQEDPEGRKCTIITFSCSIVVESNGRAKICRPNAVKMNDNSGGGNGGGGNGAAASKICCC